LDDCSDVVKIFDGRDEQSPYIHPGLCGKNKPEDLMSSGRYMTIVLKSIELSMTGKGFLAEYLTRKGNHFDITSVGSLYTVVVRA